MCKHLGLVVAAVVGLIACSRSNVTQAPPQQPSVPPAQDIAAAVPASSQPTAPASIQTEAPPVVPSSVPANTVLELNQPPREQSSPPSVEPTTDEADSGEYGTFYTFLANQGEWIRTPNYGYVFQPSVRDPHWAPYSNGHWVYTDVGWTWVSTESWGWATYHYGRWANIDGTGWVWVPGTRWAPAWVSWRHGGGYCGWAPLPPESAHVDVKIGADCDVTFHIGAGCYNLIPQQYMGEQDYRPHYVNRNNKFTIINRTTNITNITINKTVINNYNGNAGRINNFHQVNVQGPSIQEINASSETPVQRVTLASSEHRGPASVHGTTLAVFAPDLVKKTGQSAQLPSGARQIEIATVNHGETAAQPLQVSRSLPASSPVPPPEHQEPLPPSPEPKNTAITPKRIEKSAPVNGEPSISHPEVNPQIRVPVEATKLTEPKLEDHDAKPSVKVQDHQDTPAPKSALEKEVSPSKQVRDEDLPKKPVTKTAQELKKEEADKEKQDDASKEKDKAADEQKSAQ